MEFSNIKVPLGEGLYGINISTKKFKTVRSSLSFICPLNKKSAACSALLAKLLCRSTKKYPTPSLLRSRLNFLYGADLSVSTSRIGDNMLLSFSITSLCDKYALSREKLSELSSQLLKDIVFDPNVKDKAFLSEDFAVEKRIVIEEIESLINEKRRYAITKMLEKMCWDEPFGIICDTETVESISPSELYDFWENMLRTSEAVVMTVGENDPDPVFQMFKDAFSLFKRNPLKIYPNFKRIEPEKVKNITEEMSITQGKLVLGFRCDASSLTENIAPLRVMTDIFGGAPYSKLFTVVREKMSLCYYCAARLYSVKGIICVDSGIEMNNFESAKNGILEQLELMKSGDFTDDIITASKVGLSDSIRSVEDSMGGIEAWYLARIFDKETVSPSQFIERINTVTRDDIIKAANGTLLDTIYLLKGNGGDLSE